MCARSVLPLCSVSAKKSIGKELTFYQRGGSQKVRVYSATSYEASPAQATQRLIIKAKVEAWQALSAGEKAAWNAQAKTRGDPWSGYTLFMSLHEVPSVPAPVFVSAESNSTGTIISITFDKAMDDPSGKHAEFSFKEDAAPRSFSSAILDDSTIISLTVSGAPISFGSTLLISYTKGTVLAADTGILESFVDEAVSNNVVLPVSIFNFRISGRYHCTGISGPDVIRQVNASYVYALPFFCGGALTFDRIAFFCTKKASQSGVFLGVYLDNDSMYPGSLVLTSDMLDAQSAGLKESVIDWTSVADKLYWLVWHCNKGPTVKGMSDYRCFGSPFGMPSPLSSHQQFYYYDAWAFDVLPETFTPGAIMGEWVYVPAVFLRAA